MKRLALCLLLAGCVRQRMPESIAQYGGFYQPWTATHTAHRDTVLACLGLAHDRPNPTLWIARASLSLNGQPVWAYYDGSTNAVVFAGTMPVEVYWAVFRHEIVHAADRQSGHGRPFDRAAECGVWPAR